MPGILVDHLKMIVIRPVLTDLGLWSPAAEALMLGTAAQESLLGFYLKQYPEGPALGIYQMEDWVHDDVWEHYLKYNTHLAVKVRSWAVKTEASEMTWNMGYATAVTRANYFRHPTALPDAEDIPGLARYWKKYHNTVKGKGTVEEFEKHYRELVLRSP